MKCHKYKVLLEKGIWATGYNKKQIKELTQKLENEENIDIRIQLESEIEKYKNNMENDGVYGMDISFNCDENLLYPLYNQGKFILAYYDSNRETKVDIPNGKEGIKERHIKVY